MTKRTIFPGLCALFLLLFPILAHSAELTPQLQSVLPTVAPGETVPIIVTFAGDADLRPRPAEAKKARRTRVAQALRETAEGEQRAVRALLRARGKRFDPLWIVNGLSLAATPELIATLAAQPNVERLDYDDVVVLPEVEPAAAAADWNIAAVRAPELWARGYTGEGVTIAILDSGVDVNHPDLAARYHGGPAAWYDPYRRTTVPYDVDGHGTLVAGVAVGGNTSGSYIGVAPGARWVAAKIFRDDGVASNSEILKAFQWLLDPDGDPATNDAVADVVNNSWGFEDAPGVCDSYFRTAVQNLKAAGMAIVFAGGNTGPGAGVSPANYAESFAVGATNPFSLLAEFSARGPSACDGTIFPELVAPGVSIRSAAIAASAPSGYATVNGTSFSAPHVSGVMALLLSADGNLSPAELENVLTTSARDLGVQGADNQYGYGLLNALTAYERLGEVGVANIAVQDTAPPADDLRVDFGHIAPGDSGRRMVTVRNDGAGILRIDPIATPPQPFAVAADNCSGRSIWSGASCTIDLTFAPEELSAYTATLTIGSSDPDQPVVELPLSGQGNTPPPAPQLVAPADGAAAGALPVVLEWRQQADADGDAIEHFLVISQASDFADAAPQPVAATASGRTALSAGAGGLLLFALAAGRRRWQRSVPLLLVALLLFVAACGGGSGSDPAPRPLGDPVSESVDNLAAGTHYWKIVSQDARGARVESAVFRFTVAP